MNGQDDRIVCMYMKPADVTELAKFYAILRRTLKLRTILTKWTSAYTHKYIENNWPDTMTTKSLGEQYFIRKRREVTIAFQYLKLLQTGDNKLFSVFTDHRTSCNQLNLQSGRGNWEEEQKTTNEKKPTPQQPPPQLTTTLSNAFFVQRDEENLMTGGFPDWLVPVKDGNVSHCTLQQRDLNEINS